MVTLVLLSAPRIRASLKILRVTWLKKPSTKSRSSFRACPFRAYLAVRAATQKLFSRLSKTVAANASSMCSIPAADSTLPGSATIHRRTTQTIASMHSNA